jgi:CubicO group peptidase (beta-lactamase class C family)
MVPFQIPGVCLVVTKNNQKIIDQAFGFANVRLNVVASTNFLHRIASVSKVFTHSAIT